MQLRYWLAGMACLGTVLTMTAQTRTKLYEDYIHKYKDLAVEQMSRYRIPASITMSQALLESAAGWQGNRTTTSASNVAATGMAVPSTTTMMPGENVSVRTNQSGNPTRTIHGFSPHGDATRSCSS